MNITQVGIDLAVPDPRGRCARQGCIAQATEATTVGGIFCSANPRAHGKIDRAAVRQAVGQN